MTRAAIDALTSTALAQPTSTPLPTATAIPIGLSGTIDSVTGTSLVLKSDGDAGEGISYFIHPTCAVTVDGKAAQVTDLKDGSRVNLVLNGETQEVILIDAISPDESSLLLPVAFGGAGLLVFAMVGALVATRRRQEPFVMTYR
jgi:hypothetical protein